jgi:hypothetical protein
MIPPPLGALADNGDFSRIWTFVKGVIFAGIFEDGDWLQSRIRGNYEIADRISSGQPQTKGLLIPKARGEIRELGGFPSV